MKITENCMNERDADDLTGTEVHDEFERPNMPVQGQHQRYQFDRVPGDKYIKIMEERKFDRVDF